MTVCNVRESAWGGSPNEHNKCLIVGYSSAAHTFVVQTLQDEYYYRFEAKSLRQQLNKKLAKLVDVKAIVLVHTPSPTPPPSRPSSPSSTLTVHQSGGTPPRQGEGPIEGRKQRPQTDANRRASPKQTRRPKGNKPIAT